MLIFQVAGIGDVDGDGVPDVAWGDVESVSKYDSATFFFDIPPTCAERQKSGECAKQPQSTIGFAGTYLGKKADGYTPTLTDGSVYIGLLKADGSFKGPPTRITLADPALEAAGAEHGPQAGKSGPYYLTLLLQILNSHFDVLILHVSSHISLPFYIVSTHIVCHTSISS